MQQQKVYLIQKVEDGAFFSKGRERYEFVHRPLAAAFYNDRDSELIANDLENLHQNSDDIFQIVAYVFQPLN